MTKRVATPGFILLTTALISLVGGLLTSLAWKDGLRSNNVVILFDLLVSSAVITSILLTEKSVPLTGALAALPAFLILDHVNVGFLERSFLQIPLLLFIVMIARILYGIRSLKRAWRLGKGIMLGVDSTLIQLALISLVAIFSGAIAVYIVEVPDPRSPIKSFGDALWWAISTATTVGYGDVVPVTALGRLVASLLMVVGIGSLGIFISDMAVRVAKILMVEDLDNLPVLEREKRKIAKIIMNIEELSDEDLEILLRKIKVLHLLSHSGNENKVLEVIVDIPKKN